MSIKKRWALLFLLIIAGRAYGSFMVDPEPPIYWLPGGQDNPSISAGTNGFFAVWKDERIDGSHIYGTSISKDGSVEPCGFLISGDSGTQFNPSIAFGYYSGLKDNYLAVWWDSRTTPVNLYGARIRGNEVLDTAGIAIEAYEYSDEPPSVAYDGAVKYIVVWSTWDGDIKGRTVDVNGNVGVRFSICTEASAQYHPRISFNGTNFFVVWSDNRDGHGEIYGARVTPDGTVLDPGGIKLVNATGARGSPDVAFCGSYWLCVWEDTRDGDKDIYGTRVDAAGTVLDDPSILISEASFDDEIYPAVSSDGSQFIVTYIEWYGYKNIVNALVQTDGTVLSHHYTSNSLVTFRRYTDVAFCDTVFFALWQHCQPYRSGIVGTRIDRDGNFIDGWYGINVGITATIQSKPDCAFGGDSALVVWEESFMGVEGELIDLAGNPLKKLHIAFLERQPALAYNDPYYFCVWHGGEVDSTIKGRRISSDGVAMPETINIVEGISYTPCLDVAGGNGTFCVGWIDTRYPGNVYCSILDTSGVILQPPTNISNAATNPFIPALSICFNDSNHNYLIVWQETDLFVSDSIFCTMISKTGGILYQRVPIWGSFGGDVDRYPGLTFDGTNYFCVWKDGVNLIGRWINTAVEPGDTCLIPFNVSNPRVNAYSDGYFLTGEMGGKVWGARLSPDGNIVDTFEIGKGREHSVTTRVGEYLTTWSSFTPEPYSSYRIYGEFGPLVGIEEKGNLKSEIRNPKLVVYPNPFTTGVSINCSGQCLVVSEANLKVCPTMQIYDLSGRLVESFALITNHLSLTPDLSPGVYFLKIKGYKPVKIVKLR